MDVFDTDDIMFYNAFDDDNYNDVNNIGEKVKKKKHLEGRIRKSEDLLVHTCATVDVVSCLIWDLMEIQAVLSVTEGSSSQVLFGQQASSVSLKRTGFTLQNTSYTNQLKNCRWARTDRVISRVDGEAIHIHIHIVPWGRAVSATSAA